MGDRRKLQGNDEIFAFEFDCFCLLFAAEIDRCLRKVTEGVEIFEDIWQKVGQTFCVVLSIRDDLSSGLFGTKSQSKRQI